MSKALAIFDRPPPPSALDDQYFGETNIADRVTVPSVGVTGKIWTVNYNGEKIQLSERNNAGDEIPLSVLRVVILDYAKDRGRSYYEGEYSPDKTTAPLCWSDDGKTPNASVVEPQCSSCARCPQAVKGSKVTAQGKEVTACSEYRMLAVVPVDGLGEIPPLRLKLAPTSDYDGRSPEMQAEGWLAFRQYTELLRQRGVGHTGRLVTKMKFDTNAAWPKVVFSPDRWLEDSEKAVAGPLAKSPEVAALLNGSWTPAGADGVPVKPVTQIAAAKAAPKVVAKPAPVEEDDDEAPFEAPKPARGRPRTTAPVVSGKSVEPDAGGGAHRPGAAKAKAQVIETAPEDLAGILAEFGDDE